MANGRDTLRIVTVPDSGRPAVVLDLNDATGYWRDREAGFTFTPAAVSQQVSRRARRFGGGRVVGEIHDNGTIGWTAYVRGTTVTECSQRIEALLVQIHETARGRYIEWAPDGLSSSFLELAGPGSWTPTYDPLVLSQSQAMRVQVSFPVLPLVQWAPMRVRDLFDIDSRSDYTFDALTSSDVTMTVGGALLTVSGASAATERRVRHTARGYQLLEGQASIGSTPITTITGHKAGVLLRASASNTYTEVYVDDNGTNSRLRIDVVIAGTRTNRATVNLGSRIASGSRFFVRGRFEGQTVIAEHFDSAASSSTGVRQASAPTTTTSYTLAGGELTSLVAGYSGWSWVPANTGAFMQAFEFRPFTVGDFATPARLQFLDAIPGGAPALTDVTLLKDSSVPTWVLFAWSAHRTAQLGIYDPSAALSLSGWAETADATGYGGTIAKVTTTGSAATYTAVWQSLSLNDLDPDDFTDGRCDLEVWARLSLASTLASPTLTASIRPMGSSESFSEQFTREWGTTGRPLAKPSSGTVRRFTRLGTLTVRADNLDTFQGVLKIAGSVAAGGSGEFGLDYVWVVPARRRATGPTGVSSTGYPTFMTSGAKTTRWDLSGLMQGVNASDKRVPATGLGGSLIIVDPGVTDWYVKVSDTIPDDPTSSTTAESLFGVTLDGFAADVTPRSFMLRSA